MLAGDEGKVDPTQVPENEQPVLGGRGDRPFSEATGRRSLKRRVCWSHYHRRGLSHSTSFTCPLAGWEASRAEVCLLLILGQYLGHAK